MDSDSMDNGMHENNNDPTETVITIEKDDETPAFSLCNFGTVVRNCAYVAAFVGSVLMSYAGFILPSILFVQAHKIVKKPLPWTETVIAYFILSFDSALAVVGVCLSFKDMIMYGFIN